MVRGLTLLVACLLVLAAPPDARPDGREVEVVVTLEEPALVDAVRSSRALTRPSRRARLSVTTAYARGHLRALADAQDRAERRVRRAIPGARVGRRYSVLLNGFSLTLPAGDAARLDRLPGVAAVWPTMRYRSRLDRSVRLVGAPGLWGPALATAGNGVKIAIVDDGVDQTHPFFSPRGYAMPAGFPKGNRAYTTAKVIAARAFPPRRPAWVHAAKPFDPRNSEHGTHVAGIAAGNAGVSAGGRTLAGVAPRAYLGNYKVLTIPTASGVGLDGNSPEIAAGIEQAVKDGMDVINLSIGEPEIEPARDLVAVAIDAAARAGVVTAAAAGNDFGDFGRGSVASPGSARSAVTVAAASKAGEIAGFSSSGPTPLSLQLKPELTAPGVEILSSVPERSGQWSAFSGTSMAAPHVAGVLALLRQRQPAWTPAQLKSALVQTADPLEDALSPARQGAGMANAGRAVRPLVFVQPATLSFGLVAPGAPSTQLLRLADAGGGAGAWEVRVQRTGGTGDVAVAVPASATVPGELSVSATPAAGAPQGESWGWLLLSRAGEVRRVPWWLRVSRPALGRPTRTLSRTGTYGGDTRRGRARVSSYRYPELPADSPIPSRLDGPEQVARVVLRRPVSNFGVAVTGRGRGVNVQVRIVRAGDENRLVGYTALPLNLNPYLDDFLSPRAVSGAVRPGAGAYDVVFDSPTRAAAGRFTFRFWIDDATPPAVRLLTRAVRRGRPVVLRVTDAGSGVDPRSLRLRVDGGRRDATLRRGRVLVGTRGLARGRHRIVLQASDYQETRNMENVPRILPNTRRASFLVVVR